jgi:formylglycine-generating enzyme required for sulfatase activity
VVGKDAAVIATTTPDATGAPAADCEGAAATFIAKLGDKAPKGMSGTIRSLVAKHCADDHWSSDAVQCVRDAKDDAAVTSCTGKLTRDQGKLLEDNVLVAMSQAESASLHDNMVKITGGTFDLGEDKAEGLRLKATKATVADFWIDKHEVTRGDLAKALPGAQRPTHPETKDDTDATPLRFVDWAFADAFCQKAGKRLPTEAEWEVAALTTPSVTDPRFDHSKARLRGKDRTKTTESDLTAPSDCSSAGLCDMLGGLIEWTADDMPKQPGKKVARGASYATFQDGVSDTIHNRFALDKKKTDNTVGFRCATNAK